MTYLSRAFHVLSIDMSHDPKRVFLILGWLPPLGGGSRVDPGQFWFMNMKVLVRTNVHVENQLLISFGVDMLP